MLAGVTPAVSYVAAAQQPAAQAPVPQQAAPQQPATAAPAAKPAPVEPPPPGTTRREARFRIFAGGVPLGGESIIVDTSPTGWKVTSVGQAKAAAFLLNHAEIRYDAQSRPLAFKLEARVKESPLSINTTIAGGKATSEVIQDDKSSDGDARRGRHVAASAEQRVRRVRSGRRAARDVEARRHAARVRRAAGRDSASRSTA